MGCRIRARPPGATKRAPKLPLRRWNVSADDRGLSHTHAVLLMVAITVILAILLLLMLLGMIPSWSWAEPPLPPIVITEIVHTDAGTTCASRVYLLNNGSTVYENDCLRAVFYRDGQRFCTISTLNGHRFISSHHIGSQHLKGPGCRSHYWNPGEVMEVNLNNDTLPPGVMVTVEIVDRLTGKVVSKHTVRA